MQSLHDEKLRRRARRALRELDPQLGRWIDHLPDPWPKKPRPILRAVSALIIDQQISVHAAAAIRGRFHRVVGGSYRAESFLDLSETEFRTAGLSAAKQRTIRTVATEVASGRLRWASLNRLPDESIESELQKIHGIGPWTAQIYLLFILGRPDVVAAGDLGLQVAAHKIYELDCRPSAGELESIAERWRPYRSLACSYLWAALRAESAPPN